MINLLAGILGPVFSDPTPVTFSTIITDTTSMVTALAGWITTILSAALASPVVLTFIILAVVAGVVRLAKRLLHV